MSIKSSTSLISSKSNENETHGNPVQVHLKLPDLFCEEEESDDVRNKNEGLFRHPEDSPLSYEDAWNFEENEEELFCRRHLMADKTKEKMPTGKVYYTY